MDANAEGNLGEHAEREENLNEWDEEEGEENDDNDSNEDNDDDVRKYPFIVLICQANVVNDLPSFFFIDRLFSCRMTMTMMTKTTTTTMTMAMIMMMKKKRIWYLLWSLLQKMATWR